MPLLSFFLYALGGVMLLSLAALAWQLGVTHVRAQGVSRAVRGSIEGWLLLLAATAVVSRYGIDLAKSDVMSGVGTAWLVGYGICCALYLAVKSVRMLLMHG